MEKRKHPRLVCEYSISFEGVKITGSGTVNNLSLSGCSLQSDTDVHTGAYLELQISPPDHESPIQVGLATVRWVNGQESGLEFINLDTEQQKRLRRLLDSLEARPSH